MSAERRVRVSIDCCSFSPCIASHRIASHRIQYAISRCAAHARMRAPMPSQADALLWGCCCARRGSARHSSGIALRCVCVGSACLRLRQRVALKAQLQLVVPECRRHPLHTNKRTLTLPFGVRKCVPGTASCAHSRPYTHGWSVFGRTRQVRPSCSHRERTAECSVRECTSTAEYLSLLEYLEELPITFRDRHVHNLSSY
jgi:hypothetical protein